MSNNKKQNKMKNTNEILEMTHAELMVSSAEVKQMYRNAKIAKNLTFATNLIAQGFKHLQFQNGGCIQKKKGNDHLGKITIYVIKNGYGTGKATNTFLTLKECLMHLDGSGWGEIVSYK
jgi:hypothetical protein